VVNSPKLTQIGYICTACSRHSLQWGKPIEYPATSVGWRCFTAKLTFLKSYPPSDFHHCEQLTSNCEFSNFRSGPAHFSILLGCETLSLGDRCPTFRDSLQVSSLTLKKSRTSISERQATLTPRREAAFLKSMALYFIWIRRDVRKHLNQCIGQLSPQAWLIMWHAGPYNNLMFTGPCIIVITEESINQLDVTWYFIALLVGSTCFKRYYAHHQEFATMMLITTLVVSFLVCCMLKVRCG